MRIVLAITGGIAAYKIPELIRLFIKKNWKIIPVVSPAALKFITPLTLSTLSGEKVFQSVFDEDFQVTHLELARHADILIVAPATANAISKFSCGIADDLISTVFLTFKGPKLIVPAMHSEMFENQILQENIQKLKSIGVQFLGPAKGDLACKDFGIGRMVSPELIALKVESMTFPRLELTGKSILITAGGTREPIDSVRVISNLSTGKLGHTLAHLASFMGAQVGLISTVPVQENPEIQTIARCETVSEMESELTRWIPTFDSLFMAAAVSDFSCSVRKEKIKRTEKKIVLELEATTDLLKSLQSKKKNKIFVGFCLEDEDIVLRAKKKLKEKNLDFIVANTSKSIGQDHRDAILISAKSPKTEIFKNLSVMELSYRLLRLTISQQSH